jgi:hypothetical protein
VGQRLTVLTVPCVDDLDVGAGMTGDKLLAADLVDDDDVGLGEVLRCTDGQESGVTGAGADKGDPARVAGSLGGG